MYNPEGRIFENLTIDKAYQHAERILRRDAIKPESFRGLYDDEAIREDLVYVAEHERVFKEKANPELERTQKLATIFEAIVHEEAELAEWFGPDATTIKTSRFDDIKNGVDSIAEFHESDASASWLALGIDVTFSSDLTKKFDDIKREIDSNKLAEVKYFNSERMNMRGELKKIPHVVIGADARTIKQLAELWLEKDNTALGKHPIQFQILEEILLELKMFAEYAEQNKKHEFAGAYRKTITIVEKILEEKRSTIEDSGERDSVFEGITDNLRRFY